MVLEADFLIPQTFHVLPPPHENLDTHKSQGTSRTQLPESPASTPPEARGCGVGWGGGASGGGADKARGLGVPDSRLTCSGSGACPLWGGASACRRWGWGWGCGTRSANLQPGARQGPELGVEPAAHPWLAASQPQGFSPEQQKGKVHTGARRED